LGYAQRPSAHCVASMPSRTVVQPIASTITASSRLAGFSPNPSERQLNNRSAGGGPRLSRGHLERSLLHLQVGASEGADHRDHEPVVGLVGVGAFVWLSEEIGFGFPLNVESFTDHQSLFG
jgi:hypothetical protein